MNRPAKQDDAIDVPLLDLLLRASRPMTIDALAAAMAYTGAQARAGLSALGRAGCRLEEHPVQGVTLAETGAGVWRDYLAWARAAGGGAGASAVIEVYRQVASTQDAVRRVVESRGLGAHRAVAIADEQTAGRGRLGRRWLAPPGKGVTFSRAQVTPADQSPFPVDRLVFATAVAIARALESAGGLEALAVQIKWPNDLLVDGRKIAGILVETLPAAPGRHGGAAIIGIGVNVGLTVADLPEHAADLRDQVTSLAMLGRPRDRLRVLADAIVHTDAALDLADIQPLLAEWRSRSTLLAQHATYRSDGRIFRGRVIDLDPHEGLILQTDEGPIVHLPAATTTGT